jgi:type IV secretory pathway VirJ component
MTARASVAICMLLIAGCSRAVDDVVTDVEALDQAAEPSRPATPPRPRGADGVPASEERGRTVELDDQAIADLSDLPLVEVPVKQAKRGLFAVLATGDGGWTGIDVELSRELTAKGVPVVGLNSPRYLWQRKTPDQVGVDLRRIVRHYSQAWHLERWIVIGYSRGAEMAPFMVSRLPPEDRARTLEVAMLGATHLAELKFHAADLLDSAEHGDLPVLPEVEKLRGLPVLCVYGTEEPATVCTDLEPSLAKVLALQGGHHFGQHYSRICDAILAMLPAAPEPPPR